MEFWRSPRQQLGQVERDFYLLICSFRAGCSPLGGGMVALVMNLSSPGCCGYSDLVFVMFLVSLCPLQGQCDLRALLFYGSRTGKQIGA